MRLHDRRRGSARLGLLIMIVTASIFWGCVGTIACAIIDHRAEIRAYTHVCEELVAGGWRDVTVAECVTLFREVPE